ncbi:hypothetical protein EUTSA_v10003475mg [Eutrema salsugineum]|uniref:Uncharacterized protein n=1 Tax=Eutrema salsugineum TaxID=72664 RepID=V4L2I9_EUTSA|nr:hypothetical protein EUTSA_v10003475mg [Eutrema salsugineum]
MIRFSLLRKKERVFRLASPASGVPCRSCERSCRVVFLLLFIFLPPASMARLM